MSKLPTKKKLERLWRKAKKDKNKKSVSKDDVTPNDGNAASIKNDQRTVSEASEMETVSYRLPQATVDPIPVTTIDKNDVNDGTSVKARLVKETLKHRLPKQKKKESSTSTNNVTNGKCTESTVDNNSNSNNHSNTISTINNNNSIPIHPYHIHQSLQSQESQTCRLDAQQMAQAKLLSRQQKPRKIKNGVWKKMDDLRKLDGESDQVRHISITDWNEWIQSREDMVSKESVLFT